MYAEFTGSQTMRSQQIARVRANMTQPVRLNADDYRSCHSRQKLVIYDHAFHTFENKGTQLDHFG
jgi:hypothetical protein